MQKRNSVAFNRIIEYSILQITFQFFFFITLYTEATIKNSTSQWIALNTKDHFALFNDENFFIMSWSWQFCNSQIQFYSVWEGYWVHKICDMSYRKHLPCSVGRPGNKSPVIRFFSYTTIVCVLQWMRSSWLPHPLQITKKCAVTKLWLQ